MNTRRQMRAGWRALWAAPSWPAFRLGYMTALDDVDRTGLRPTREDTKERSAERAFRRLNGIDPEA